MQTSVCVYVQLYKHYGKPFVLSMSVMLARLRGLVESKTFSLHVGWQCHRRCSRLDHDRTVRRQKRPLGGKWKTASNTCFVHSIANLSKAKALAMIGFLKLWPVLPVLNCDVHLFLDGW